MPALPPTAFQMRRLQTTRTPHARSSPPMDIRYGSPSSASQSHSPPVFSNSENYPGQAESADAWPYRQEPGLQGYDVEEDEEERPDESEDKRMSSSSRELQESVRAAFGGSSGHNPGLDTKGRGVRNGLRSTINAAEHNISSFLFGKSPPRSQGSDEGNTFGPTRNSFARGGH